MSLNFKKHTISKPIGSQDYKKESKVEFFPQIIKVLRLPQLDPFSNNAISSLNFGPYDNGYVMLGTTQGHLLVLDPKNLNRISSVRIFERHYEAITTINYEPTQVVFLGSNLGLVKAINFIPQQMSYVYLDLG
jgi:hypothetical protein